MMEIRKISVDQLLPADYNPRKDLRPGDPEFEKLKRSVEEFGYVEPIIWNQRTGIVVGGHQRLKVLQHLGYTEVDCVVLDIDEQKEKALNVALNKISGDWDMPLLTALLKDLEESGFDATLTGFDVSEMSDMFDDQSEIKEKAHKKYSEKQQEIGETEIKELERVVMLKVVDEKWMNHIDNMDELKDGIGLRAYGQKDPVVQYRIEGSDMFEQMVEDIRTDVVKILFNIQRAGDTRRKQTVEITKASQENLNNLDNDTVRKETVKKDGPSIGRNDPCPCGSGKKYKQCCGK